MYNDSPITYGLCTEYMCKYDTFKENARQRSPKKSIEELCFGPMLDYNKISE